MTLSSGVTGVRDHSRVQPEGLDNKDLQTVWREADKNRQIFAGKIGQRPLSDLKQVKRGRTLLSCQKEGNVCPNMSPIEIR